MALTRHPLVSDFHLLTALRSDGGDVARLEHDLASQNWAIRHEL